MSVHALTWAWEQDITPSGAKFVLIALADHADEHGYCYPGQKRLARFTSMSDRTVRGHLAALEEMGVIRRRVRRAATGERTSDGYFLLGYRAWKEELDDLRQQAAESATSRDNRQKTAGQPAENDTTTGRKQPIQPAESATKPSGEPAVEPSGEPSGERAPSARIIVAAFAERRYAGRKLPNAPMVAGQAKRLLGRVTAGEFTMDDVLGCMDWLQADDWWDDKGWTLHDVDKQIDKYLQTRNGNGKRGTSSTRPTLEDRNRQHQEEWLRGRMRTEVEERQERAFLTGDPQERTVIETEWRTPDGDEPD